MVRGYVYFEYVILCFDCCDGFFGLVGIVWLWKVYYGFLDKRIVGYELFKIFVVFVCFLGLIYM